MTDYKRFFDEAPVGLYKTKKEDGLFVDINPFGAKLLGFSSPEDVIGKVKSSDLYDQETRKLLLKEMHNRGKVTDFEIKLNKPDGTIVWVSATGSNGNEYIVGSLTDITERKELQLQISKLRDAGLKKLKEISEAAQNMCNNFNVG